MSKTKKEKSGMCLASPVAKTVLLWRSTFLTSSFYVRQYAAFTPPAMVYGKDKIETAKQEQAFMF